jgi:predicted anti-sigma-YlaC factor YlaD
MNHLNEEQFVLYYYGEQVDGVEDHLGACEQCRVAYHTLQRVLNSVDSLPVPERGAD